MKSSSGPAGVQANSWSVNEPTDGDSQVLNQSPEWGNIYIAWCKFDLRCAAYYRTIVDNYCVYGTVDPGSLRVGLCYRWSGLHASATVLDG